MEATTFKQRFMPHWRHLFWTAWRLTGNTQDAEDLVQEAFMKLWTKRDSLGDIENDEAYLTTLVTNMFRDMLRRKHLDMANCASDTLSIADETSLMAEVEARDESEQVCRLIGKLPEQQRRIITMHAVDDLPTSDIEAKTGLTAINVRTLLSRARKNIRMRYEKTVTKNERYGQQRY